MSDMQIPLIAEYGIDAAEAPPGYYPVLKESLDHDKGNLCRQCDWRPVCQTDIVARNPGDTRYRCMSWARRDGMSVAFKRRAEVDTHIKEALDGQ